MSAGTTVGLIVAAGIGTAGSITAAKMQSNAAKKAAGIQVDASNKAMDYQQKAQAQAMDWINQQKNTPIQPMGGAAGYLGQRLGIPQGYGGLMGGAAAPQPPQAQPPKMGFAGAPATGTASGAGYGSLLGGATQSAPPPSGMQSAPPSGGMVTLEAPTGERQSFPAGPQVDAMIRAGARRVS